MHLCRFNGARVGLVDNGRVHDVSSLIDMSAPEPVLAAIKAGKSFSAAELKRVPDYAVSDVVLLSPSARRGKSSLRRITTGRTPPRCRPMRALRSGASRRRSIRPACS
jgi:hypothetical protein